MAAHKRLGIHWGEKGFVFVEVARDVPVLTAFVPFSSPDDAPVVGLKSLSDDIKLLDVLQKTVRNKGISTVEVYLSLPSKDILIRWFLIPWVKTSEIQDVVGFEIKKYIPFSIEEISYTYYPRTVLKDGLRQIGILFVGIRKNSFEKYINVLTQAGLNVVYSEPSAMSLVRALVSKRLLDLNQVTAILQTSDESGELIITSGGQVKFIRDFRTHLGQGDGDAQDALRARIFGEVRISLEFFSRQYAEEEVSRIVIISSEMKQSLWSGLSDDLGITVNVVDPLKEIGGGEGMDIGGVNAFGATMAGNVSAVIDFNLSENSSQPVALKKEEVSQRNRQLIMPILVGIGCVAMIGAIFFIGGIFVEGMRQQLVNASMRVGGYEEMPLDEIQSKASVEQKRMDAVGSLPLKPRAAPLIILLTKIVSREGVWLSSIDVVFVDGAASGKSSQSQVDDKAKGKARVVYAKISTRVTLTVTGYVYKDDSNQEFDLANEVVNDLRKDKTFSDIFSSIKLSGLRSEQVLVGKKATVFSIACEGK